MAWWVVLAVVVGYGIWVFNRLIADRNLVAQAFADIDVQLKRRTDLVPRLVEVVRGYAAYERATLEADVADLLSNLLEAGLIRLADES